MENKNDLITVLNSLQQAEQLLRVGIERGTLSAIERDILLEKLRTCYDHILFEGSMDSNKISLPKEVLKPIPADAPQEEAQYIGPPKTAVVNKETQPKDVELEQEMVLPEEEQVAAAEQKVNANITVPIEKAESPVQLSEPLHNSKPEVNIEVSRETMPLKGSVSKQPIPNEVMDNPQDRQSSTTTLADKFQGTKKYRNEVLGAGKKDMASVLKNKPINDLTKSIGINDKFLYTKELFNGNAELYAKSIAALNGFTDINDALIFIQDNFQWDDKNEAANQLIDLVRRKLLHD